MKFTRLRFSVATLAALSTAIALTGCGGGKDGGSTDMGRLLVVREEGGNKDIYTLALDGTVVKRLTTDPAADNEPRFSPDQSKIVFVREVSGRESVYVMNADGSGATELTPTETAYDPRWTPGGKIAYASGTGAASEIWTMNADGSGKVRLTSDAIGDICPEVSPDGTSIAYMKSISGTHIIYLMNADGTNQRPLLGPGSIAIGSLAFSRDGSKLAYVSSEAGNKEVYLIPVSGVTQDNVSTLLKRLTTNPADDFSINWSPDGSKLLFASLRDGNSELYVMNPDGSGQTRVTNNTVGDIPFGWR